MANQLTNKEYQKVIKVNILVYVTIFTVPHLAFPELHSTDKREGIFRCLCYSYERLRPQPTDSRFQKLSHATRKKRFFVEINLEVAHLILKILQVKKLSGYLGSDFTYAFGGKVGKLPNKMQLANALGYLSFDQVQNSLFNLKTSFGPVGKLRFIVKGIHTLVTPLVDTNWPEPTKGYTMFLDQNTAYMRLL